MKELAGIDLAAQDPQIVKDFMFDPVLVATSCWYLYEPHLMKANISENDYYELVGEEEIVAMREVVIEQMRGFSSLWRITVTEMEAILSGDMTPEELATKAETQARLREAAASGPSS